MIAMPTNDSTITVAMILVFSGEDSLASSKVGEFLP